MPLRDLLRRFSSHSSLKKSKSRPGSSGSNRAGESGSDQDVPPVPRRHHTAPPVQSTSADITPLPADPSFSADLTEAWEAAHKEAPKAGRVERALNAVGAFQESQAGVISLAAPAADAFKTPAIAQAIEKGFDGVLEAVPTLMKALDEVAKVHPFISVAVLAFKAVYTLETIRRDNDKKIISLYMEMRDTISVLIQLKNVKDVEQIGPDNRTIKGRLQELCTQTAQDIKNCSNTCDTYLKKKLVVKIFAGPIWEGKLLEFVELFMKRRQEYEFALTVHTSLGVDEANIKLASVDARTEEIAIKMQLMLLLFQKFVTPEQEKMMTFIQSKGIDTSHKEDAVLKELIEYESELTSSKNPPTKREKAKPSEVRREIEENPDIAIKNNAELFDRKFEIQRRQIEAEIARAMHREGDRIITAVTGGPGDRLVDPDIYKIWKDMGWRGSVKARHFVLALRDYYQEKAGEEGAGGVAEADKWALEYINLSAAQRIQEAFDDDASGFITIQEVNRLTQMRPREWSLPHWLAYHAVGWQSAVTFYSEKIEEVFTAMFSLLDKIKPVNRRIVDQYLQGIWGFVMGLIQPVEKFASDDAFRSRFRLWVKAEQDRLTKNLEDIRYDIDDVDTVRLVTGPGRIEMYLYPLIWLVMKRHLEIFSLAQTRTITEAEMWDAENTLTLIAHAALARLDHLQNVCRQQRLDPNVQFQTFGCGMFSLWNESPEFSSIAKLRSLPDPQLEVDPAVLPQTELDPELILNHPLGEEFTIDLSAYDAVAVDEQQRGENAILGRWEGLFFSDFEMPFLPKFTFEIKRGDEENTFTANGTHHEGAVATSFTVEGHNDPESDGVCEVNFKIIYQTRYHPIDCKAKVDGAEGSIRGAWFQPKTSGYFVFKRSPDHIWCYPPPSLIVRSPATTRWKFALDYVLHMVKRDMWSKSFFLDHIRDRKRYVELATRAFHYGKDPNQEEWQEIMQLYGRLTAADIRFCTSIITHHLASNSLHLGVVCDSCESKLGRARVICMDCQRTTSSIDFCEDPDCAGSTLGIDQIDGLVKPHLPTHEVFKVYAVLHGRYYAMTERRAKEALKQARALLKEDKVALGNPSEIPVSKSVCSHCKEKVALSPPCWACVECPELFICDSCDTKGIAFTEQHTYRHAIVRCQPAVDDAPAEDQLVTMERRLTQQSEERFAAIESRLLKMEAIMGRVLGKLERNEVVSLEDVKMD